MRFVVLSGNQEIFDRKFLKKKKKIWQIHSNSSKIHVNTSIKMDKHNEWPLRKILDKLYMFFSWIQIKRNKYQRVR